ncbi:MAG: hypothetical protein KGL39_57505 [Patescibacteria group bacterium]|nr:hypothetical protein [Patescibacteria group bacterium]
MVQGHAQTGDAAGETVSTERLTRLWVDRHGGLTAKPEDSFSMPLYSAANIDKRDQDIVEGLHILAGIPGDYPKDLIEAFKQEAFDEESEEALSFSQWMARRLLQRIGSI